MRMRTEAFEPGWLRKDAMRAALSVARDELAEAEREVRNANDILTDACTKLKVARAKVAKLERDQR